MKRRRSLTLVALLAALVTVVGVRAQGPCGPADGFSFPLDTARFQIVQNYAVPSARHDGRFHTGEDWAGPRGQSYGTPVHAIARGRVTYAAPEGWGRDKGVVILEHQMPDGSTWYSMYGHMEQSDAGSFPPVYACVERGDVIGVVGNVRPAPHLHLEIRSSGPDSPGAGYSRVHPDGQGLVRPSEFILDRQVWLHPAYRWHAALSDAGGARGDILRQDATVIALDAGRLLGLSISGGVLWRYDLDPVLVPAGLAAYSGAALVAGTEGALQLWNPDGSGLREAWALPHRVGGPPLAWADLLIVPAEDGALIAYGPDRAERWRAAAAPGAQIVASAGMLAVLTADGGLTLIAPDGSRIGQAGLGGPGMAAPAPDGGILLYGGGALWRISPRNEWLALGAPPPVNPQDGAVFALPDGRFVLYDGAPDRVLSAYASDGSPLWRAALPDLQGRPTFLADGGALLLVDGYGQGLVVGVASGGLCGTIHPWGWRASEAWAALGLDGVLRLHVADQVIGLDWAALASGCR